MNYTKIDFSQRNVGIDLFRALTTFVIIFVNDFWKIHDVPYWLEHAKQFYMLFMVLNITKRTGTAAVV